MEPNDTDANELRVDRTVFSVVDLHDADDKEYWWSKTTEERLEAVEINRRIVYGYAISPTVERVLKVVRR